MKKAYLCALIALAACAPSKPRDTSAMETGAEIAPPQQAIDFCKKHPEFKQC